MPEKHPSNDNEPETQEKPALDLVSLLFPDFEKRRAESTRKNQQARRVLQEQIDELSDTIPAVVPLLEAAKVFLDSLERRSALLGGHDPRWKELSDATRRYLKEHTGKTPPKSHSDECRAFIDDLSSWWLPRMAEKLSEGAYTIEDVEQILAHICAERWTKEMKRTREECGGGFLSQPLGALDGRAKIRLRARIGDMLKNKELEAWPALARRVVTALLREAGVTTKQADRIVPKWKPTKNKAKTIHSDDSAKRRNSSDNPQKRRNDSDEKKSRRNGETP